MKKEKSVILVPTDFSSEAECAINHASVIAQKSGEGVTLLHVINQETKANLKKKKEGIESLVKKLQSQCDYYSQKFNLKFDYVLKEGSIFSTIEKVREELNASFVVLGTHGVRGIQHVTGAYALRVVASSKVPVIIVQNRLPENHGYKHIVAPVDHTVEIKHKTKATLTIAKTFDANIHLYKMAGYDTSLSNKIKQNAQFIKKYANQNGLDVTEGQQKSNKSNFAEDFLDYARENDADLIVIMTTVEKGLKDIVLGPEEQMVINNADQIPVMCVNPMNIFISDRLSNIVNLSF